MADGQEPIRRVAHFHADGLWQFLANREGPDDEPVVLHAEHLLQRDSSLRELLSLRPGQVAIRVEPGRPWLVLNFKTDAEFDEMLEDGTFESYRPPDPEEDRA